MIPKKTKKRKSRTIVYNNQIWRYFVKFHKFRRTHLTICYTDPNNKFHSKDVEVLDECYYGGEGQKREITPSYFIQNIILK